MFAQVSDKTCFLDGSGKVRQHKVVAFCGLIAHPAGLEDFEAMWQSLLAASGLSSGLHMAEAMAWRGDVWPRLRAQWGDHADTKRAELLRGFVEVVRCSPLRPVGSIADSSYLIEKSEHSTRPDLVMFEKALELATNAMHPQGSLTVLSDWEDGFDVLCVQLLAKLRSERPTIGGRVQMLGFCNDRAFSGIQAADMFTYLAIQNAVRQRDRPDEPVDPLFARLIEPPVATMTSLAMHELYDAETFRRMVEAHRR